MPVPVGRPENSPGWNGTEPEQREGEGAVEPWERRQRAILSSVGRRESRLHHFCDNLSSPTVCGKPI